MPDQTDFLKTCYVSDKLRFKTHFHKEKTMHVTVFTKVSDTH